ncbi:ribbon-helix-helix protein, CopG family [Nocardiopsis sp. NPDC058631]|uniref:ribbon-helix-helix protein, CopG family n=1 Tax=Nocardiopsis sp. NPDC058631 TaxID=3346566 RepID=UPI00364AD1AF
MSYQKISVNLSDEVMQALKAMVERDNVTMTEAIRRAISTQKFLDDAQRSGQRILLEDPESKDVQRIVFR